MALRVRIGGTFLSIVLLLAPLAANGAESKSPASGNAANSEKVLTLKDLIVKALKYSPQVKSSQSDVTLAKEQKAEAHGYRFPQFDAVGLGGVVTNARRGEVRQVGKDKTLFYPDPSGSIHGVNVFGNLTFTLIQPLYTFGKIAYRERAAGDNIKIKRYGVTLKQGEVIYNVSHAYYGLILANQGKGAVADARTYLRDARVRITRLLQINSPNVKETDQYRLAMYEGGVEKFAAQADEGSMIAYRALKGLIGYGENHNFQVPENLPEPTAPPAGLDYYIKEALNQRPEFKQLKHGLAARELLVEAAKADRLPSFFFAVLGQVAGAPGREHNPDPYVNDFFNGIGAMPALGVQWHFDFGILKAKIGQARAELQKLQYDQKTALMGIPIEVAKDYGKLKENYKGSIGMEKGYVNARRWLITAFSNFDMGLGSMDEIFRAFERYGSFRGDYLQTLFDYNMAVVKLDKSTGSYVKYLPAAEKHPKDITPSQSIQPASATMPVKPTETKGQ
jgi:outer membrane protein